MDPAVAHVEALDDAMAYQSAALDDPPPHKRYVVRTDDCVEHRQTAQIVANRLAEMRTPDEYRDFAAECYRFAAEAKTEAYRKTMEEMARAWSEVAVEVESTTAEPK